MEIHNAQLNTITEPVKAGLGWLRRRLLLIALISLGIAVPLCLLEHDARLRRDLEFRQVKEQAAAEIASLRAQAAAALEDADAGAQRVRDLEARGHQLERREADLKSQISDLKARESARLQEVAALPFPAIAAQLRTQLGPDGFGARASGLETRNSGRGEDRNSKLEIRTASTAGGHAPAQAGAENPDRTAGDPEFQIQDSRPGNTAPPITTPESRATNPGLILTERGARAMAAALVERDACREQANAKDALLANCEQQAAATRAIVGELMRSEVKLRETARLKDQILSRSEAAHRAELKAARGSRLSRVGRALKYVAAGVVIGLVVAR